MPHKTKYFHGKPYKLYESGFKTKADAQKREKLLENLGFYSESVLVVKPKTKKESYDVYYRDPKPRKR